MSEVKQTYIKKNGEVKTYTTAVIKGMPAKEYFRLKRQKEKGYKKEHRKLTPEEIREISTLLKQVNMTKKYICEKYDITWYRLKHIIDTADEITNNQPSP